MSMDGNVMGEEIIAAIDAVVAGNPTATTAQRRAIWRAIGRAIVHHIQNNAEVDVDSVTGVTVGGGNSGPGTGTVD